MAVPGCLIIVALLALAEYGLYIFLRPANSTTVGEVSGKLTDSFIDFNPDVNVDLDLHGSGCWTTFAVLATPVILILMAIALSPG